MEVAVSDIISAIALVIAVLSLTLTYKVYKRDTPKLKVDILDPKYDCFFGDACLSGEGMSIEVRVAGVYVSLRNDSKVSMEIRNIELDIKNERFQRVSPSNTVWSEFAFYSSPQDKNLDNNSDIDYCESGIHLPRKIEPYSVINGYVLFNNFPRKIKEQTRATLVVRTAAGTVKKRVKLLVYNNNQDNQLWEVLEQYERSRGKDE